MSFEPSDLSRGEFSVSTALKFAEFDIHESDTAQLRDFIPQMIAHTSYLAVEALMQDYPEGVRSGDFDFAGQSDLSEYRQSVLH